MRDVRKYEVFNLADHLVLRVYKMTAAFPKDERFGLTAQLRRAACSVPINLAEGAARSSAREFSNFVNIAIGSCEEVRYELHLAQALGYLTVDLQLELDGEYERVKQMLARLFRTIAGEVRPAADQVGNSVPAERKTTSVKQLAVSGKR